MLNGCEFKLMLHTTCEHFYLFSKLSIVFFRYSDAALVWKWWFEKCGLAQLFV